MSSFIVSDKTLGQILYQFLNPNRSEYDAGRDVKEIAQAMGRNLGVVTSTDPIWDDLPLALQELNNRAVNARYSEDNSVMAAIEVVPTSLVEPYKSLRCFLYQCSEGDIPQTSELYNALDAMASRWADEIVCALPEYEKAPWDAQ